MDYCAVSDLYSFGLPRGSLPNPAHLAASVSIAQNSITIDQHGLSLNDPITVRAESGGSLPAPLLEGTRYYAIPLTDSAFSLAATSGGSAIDLTTVGMHVLVIFPNPIASAIKWASTIVDQGLVAHPVPLAAPFPPIIVLTCAELAAAKALGLSGASSKSLTDMADAAVKRVEKWAKGIPLRGENRPPPANVATSAVVPYLDRRGWNRFGGT